MPFLAYHDYEGIALNSDERVRLVSDIGTKTLLLLRNHGTLSIGKSAAEAWLGIYFLERACRQQVVALSAGRSGVLLAPDAAQSTSHDQAITLFLALRNGHGRVCCACLTGVHQAMTRDVAR